MAESMNRKELTHCEERGGKKNLSIDGKTFKKSPSVWSFKDYPCEACGKTFTQCHTLHTHKKYHCKMLETEQIPKEECPNCGKMVSKMTIYSNAKNGCPKLRKSTSTVALAKRQLIKMQKTDRESLVKQH